MHASTTGAPPLDLPETRHDCHLLLAPAAALLPARRHRLVPCRLGLGQGLRQRRMQQGRGGGHHSDRLAPDLVQQLPHRGQLLNIEASQHQCLCGSVAEDAGRRLTERAQGGSREASNARVASIQIAKLRLPLAAWVRVY